MTSGSDIKKTHVRFSDIVILFLFIPFFVSAFSGLCLCQTGTAAKSGIREVAFTFDDLPLVAIGGYQIEEANHIVHNLIDKIKQNKIPVVGFANEQNLYTDISEDGISKKGNPVESRVELLKMWINAGLELGNHTYSHPSMNSTPLKDFEADLIRGEGVIKRLLKEKGMVLRFFRHPFLHTGLNMDERMEFEKFLSAKRYTIAPVTVDNSEWIFAKAYNSAYMSNDPVMMKKVAAAYIPYMEKKFEYFERCSRDLFGYEIKQILLLHANKLNSDCLNELASMLSDRGYKFISLTEALGDKAYSSADSYYGKGGISWLHRWAKTQGIKGDFYKGEPETPAFVLKQAGIDSE